MKLSDIDVPEFWPTLIVFQCITAVAVLALVFVLFNAWSEGKKKLSRRQVIAGGVLLAIVFGVQATSIVRTNEMTDRQNNNFAAALQRTYGATSSKTYQEIRWSRTDESTLTRDGKVTLVRFDVDGGTIRPVIPSQSDYPALDGSKP